MAIKKFLVDIDLNKNQLLNPILQNLATDPGSPSNGQIYYNTTANEVRAYVNGSWVDLGELYSHPSFTAYNPDLSGAKVLASIETNTEGHVTSVTARTLTLGDLGYTGDTDANKYVHPTFTGNDLGAALTGATVISDVNVNSEGHVTGFTTRNLGTADLTNDANFVIINDSATNLTEAWSGSKIQDELDAINSTISGALVYQGGYNASTNSPDLDTTPSGVSKGDTYTVTAAGNFFTEAVQVGDMIIAEVDNPSVLTDWTVVNKNIDDIVSASTTAQGIVELATNAEAETGTDTQRAVTPAGLHAGIGTYRYNSLIGDGASQSFSVNHNLGSANPSVLVVDTTDSHVVEAQLVITSANQITIDFNNVPSSNQYRVAVIV